MLADHLQKCFLSTQLQVLGFVYMYNRKRYIFLLFVYALFTIVLAGFELNWASAAGYNFVPLFIAYFIIKKATYPKRFFGASFVIVALFSALNAIEAKNRYDLNSDAIYTGCFEKNIVVAQMETDAEKEQFCECFSGSTTAFAMRQDALVFYRLAEDLSINQNSAAQSFLNDAFMQCSAP